MTLLYYWMILITGSSLSPWDGHQNDECAAGTPWCSSPELHTKACTHSVTQILMTIWAIVMISSHFWSAWQCLTTLYLIFTVVFLHKLTKMCLKLKCQGHLLTDSQWWYWMQYIYLQSVPPVNPPLHTEAHHGAVLSACRNKYSQKKIKHQLLLIMCHKAEPSRCIIMSKSPWGLQINPSSILHPAVFWYILALASCVFTFAEC